MNQAHPMRVHFKVLRAACLQNGLSASLNIFEGGEAVTIRTGDGTPLLRVSRDDDSSETASSAAAHWLIERKYLTLDELNSASPH